MAMNITIEQSDIEAAVEAHVRELIPGLSPETVVDISLSATRGPAGFTASIRLLSAEEAKAEKKAATAASKVEPVRVKTSGNKPLGIAAAAEANKATRAAPAKPAEAAPATTQTEAVEANEDLKALPAETVTETAVADVTTEAGDPPFDTDTQAEAGTTATVEAAEEPTTDAPRRSLFGNRAEASPVVEDAQPETEAAPRTSVFAGMSKPEN